MSAIIYLLTNTLNGKQYIGQTIVGLERRWKRHCSSACRGSTTHLHKAIRKYGPDAFIQEILEQTTIEEVNDRETYWIAVMKCKETGYNMTEGGEGTRGCIPGKEIRTKMSESRLGEKNPNFGKVFTDEHRQKLSGKNNGMYQKGYLISGEKHPMYGKRGEDNPNYGSHRTSNQRQTIAQSLIGKFAGEKNPMYGKKGKEHPAFGRTVSKEVRAKLSALKKGIPRSPETCAKISASKKLRARMKRITAPEATIHVC